MLIFGSRFINPINPENRFIGFIERGGLLYCQNNLCSSATVNLASEPTQSEDLIIYCYFF